jgi:RNA polymerase sigma factor (TIGR02999 family)
MADVNEVTQILRQIEAGDPSAAEELLPLVYDELRRLAAARMSQEVPDHTLQATALVHEAYVRLVDQDEAPRWNHRGHFFAAAAEAMRRILVESARRKQSLKQGGEFERRPLDDDDVAAKIRRPDLLALDEALQRLAEQRPEIAQLVTLRYFGGLTMPQAAESMGIPLRTAERHWTYARAWLLQAVADGE